MADYGIKMSKPGFDVSSATDGQLQFSSEFSYLKIQATYESNAALGSQTIFTHNLGYIPAVDVFYMPQASAPRTLLPGQLSPALYSGSDPLFGGGDTDYATCPLVTDQKEVHVEILVNSTQLKVNLIDDDANTGNRNIHARVYIDAGS